MSTKKTFEENLQDLEAIVTKLETGDVALEDAIAEFQKGMLTNVFSASSKVFCKSLDRAIPFWNSAIASSRATSPVN